MTQTLEVRNDLPQKPRELPSHGAAVVFCRMRYLEKKEIFCEVRTLRHWCDLHSALFNACLLLD